MEMIILAGSLLIAVIVLLFLIINMMNTNRQNAMFRQIILNEQKESQKQLQQKEEQLALQLQQIKDRLSQELYQFQNQLSQSMKGDFHQLNESTVNRLITIERQMNQGMLQSFEATHQAFGKVMEQMARIDETQKHLQDLSKDINGLQGILTDKKARGTFGEVQLYTLLENIYGVNDQRYQRQKKLSTGVIADCVLLAPKPLGNIVIDSKFPLENYNRMVDSQLNPLEQERAKNEFKKDVTRQIKGIAAKYLIPEETAEFAYMFIPAEAIFATLIGQFDDLVQLGYKEHVYLVSPTTLMAYMTAIQAIYLGQQRSEKMELIQQETVKLSREFERFVQRWQIIEKDFEKTWRDVQNVSITAEKMIARFRQIEAADIEESIKTSSKT